MHDPMPKTRKLTPEEEGMLTFHILAGYETCAANGCHHIRRGYRDVQGKIHWAPGIYCQCCIVAIYSNVEEDDAYTCDGRDYRHVKV